MKDKALREVIKKVGSMNALARALCITRQAIQNWERVPVPRVIEIEKLTGIPREKLRPDFYPP